MANDWTEPTPETPTLVGVLVDVSGSMAASIENEYGDTTTRLEAFRDSLGDLAGRADELSRRAAGDESGEQSLLHLFAYGFGFGGLRAFLWGKTGPEVRDLLDVPSIGPSTVPIRVLSERWREYEAHVTDLSDGMFGGTPMAKGFRAAAQRFEVERTTRHWATPAVLFVLSDGEPDGAPATVEALAKKQASEGVLIVSCYVTTEDIVEPRRLYRKPQPDWPPGARLMFNCASEVPANSPFESHLNEYGWNYSAGARLFTQVNQSDILSEFLEVTLSPLRSKSTPQTRRQEDPRKNLRRLLASIFSPDELRMWLQDTYGPSVTDALPASPCPPQSLTFSAVQVLERTGHLEPELFVNLERARPARKQEIRALASDFRRQPGRG